MILKKSHLMLAPLTVLGLSVGCSKSEKESTPAATTTSGVPATGVEKSNSNDVKLTGQLALESFSLTAGERGILLFTTYGGRMSGSVKEIEVGADGEFEVPLQKASDSIATLQAFAAKSPSARTDADYQSVVDALEAIGQGGITADYIKALDEEDIQQGIGEMAEQMEKQGAINLLVEYTKSATGDKVEEAASFHFIGLPTAGGQTMSAISTADVAGNLNFGEVSQSASGQAVTELEANEDSFNLSEDAIASFASAGEALKAVKNAYMNDKWEATPFFVWNNAVDMAEVVNQFGDPSTLDYHGYGFYVGSAHGTEPSFTYDQICGTTGAPSVSLAFTPPSAVQELDYSNVAQSVSSYSNASVTRSTQGDSRICSGGGIYIREDVRDDELSFMLNFGTGGSITTSPAGLWTLDIGSTEEGRFDLALASPIDSDGNPVVFMPVVKAVVSGGNVTGVEVKFSRWNGSEYEVLTDVAPITRLVSAMSGSVTKISTNGEERIDEGAEWAEADGVFSASFDNAVAQSDISAIAFYYMIGDASYRVEYRNR